MLHSAMTSSAQAVVTAGTVVTAASVAPAVSVARAERVETAPVVRVAAPVVPGLRERLVQPIPELPAAPAAVEVPAAREVPVPLGQLERKSRLGQVRD